MAYKYFDYKTREYVSFFLLPIAVNKRLTKNNFYISYFAHIHYNFKEKCCSKMKDSDKCACANLNNYNPKPVKKFIINIAIVNKNKKCHIRFITIYKKQVEEIKKIISKSIYWRNTFNIKRYPIIDIEKFIKKNIRTMYLFSINCEKNLINNCVLADNINLIDNSINLKKQILSNRNINILNYNHHNMRKKKKKTIHKNIVSIASNSVHRNTIKNSLYNSYHRIVCKVPGNSYTFPINSFVKTKFIQNKNLTEITVNSFPAFYWSLPGTLNSCYQNMTHAAQDYLTHYNKDILFVKFEYKNSFQLLNVSANVLVKNLELFQDVVLPVEFYQDIVKASIYFHSTKYFTFSASPDNSANLIKSPTFYWENDEVKIRIYNRSNYKYKNQTAIKNYVILRFELVIKRYQTVYNKIIVNNKSMPNNTDFSSLFNLKVKKLLFDFFRKQLTNIFPLPPKHSNIINISGNKFFDCDKKWNDDHIFKRSELKKIFMYKAKLKNEQSNEIAIYMRQNIDNRIINFFTRYALNYPLIVTHIMYLFFEHSQQKTLGHLTGHLSDNSIAQIVKINRRKYFPALTKNIIVSELSERYANTNQLTIKKQTAISKTKLMELINGASLENIL